MAKIDREALLEWLDEILSTDSESDNYSQGFQEAFSFMKERVESMPFDQTVNVGIAGENNTALSPN